MNANFYKKTFMFLVLVCVIPFVFSGSSVNIAPTGSGSGGTTNNYYVTGGGWDNTTTTTSTTLNVNISGNATVDGLIFNGVGYPYGDGTPEYWNPYILDFTSCLAGAVDPFSATAISSGTLTLVTGTAKHIGICALKDSTTANGGYRVMSDVSAFLINGTERARFIFQVNGVLATQRARLGFQDSTAGSTLPTDGVYFNVSATTQDLRGIARNNNVQSFTSTGYTMTANTWYNGILTINDDASSVAFELWNEDMSTQLWTDTLSSNIPHTTGRETGFGVLAAETTTSASANILIMDFMNLQIKRKIR